MRVLAEVPASLLPVWASEGGVYSLKGDRNRLTSETCWRKYYDNEPYRDYGYLTAYSKPQSVVSGLCRLLTATYQYENKQWRVAPDGYGPRYAVALSETSCDTVNPRSAIHVMEAIEDVTLLHLLRSEGQIYKAFQNAARVKVAKLPLSFVEVQWEDDRIYFRLGYHFADCGIHYLRVVGKDDGSYRYLSSIDSIC
jgi:hypothetical protein